MRRSTGKRLNMSGITHSHTIAYAAVLQCGCRRDILQACEVSRRCYMQRQTSKKVLKHTVNTLTVGVSDFEIVSGSQKSLEGCLENTKGRKESSTLRCTARQHVGDALYLLRLQSHLGSCLHGSRPAKSPQVEDQRLDKTSLHHTSLHG